MGLRQRWPLWTSVVLLWVLVGFLMHNAWAQSPTMDEQNHIARGYALLRTGDPRLSLEHPPLINVVEALPLLSLGTSVRLPLDDWSWEAGQWYYFADQFMWFANHDADRMVFLARLPVIAMTLLLAALAARWARELWGGRAGVLAMSLVVFDPNILAHGSLATTDLGLTFTAFLSAYAVWRALRSLSWRSVLLAGLATGAMLSSKTSALMFWGVFGVLAAGWTLRMALSRDWWREVWRYVGTYAVITTIAFLVLWAGYVFQSAPVVENGPSLPLGTYWRGLLTVFQTVQGGRPSYLLGETSLDGWPLYFPITFAVKTPIPLFLMVLLAILVTVKSRRWRSAIFLLLPVAVYWFFALRSTLNIGYRHLLPTLPFVYVWVAVFLGSPKSDSTESGSPKVDVWGRWVVVGGFVLWLVVGTVGIAPHFLSYFNVFGGGSGNGWRVVADSNIDWGQDLKALGDYVAQQNLGRVKLSWFGSARPEAYGIDFEPLPGLPHYANLWTEPSTFDTQQPEPGVYVISVSNLVELPLEDKRFFAYFRDRKPDARIGYSVYVYKVGLP